MKINLSKYESYEISLPEEVNPTEFLEMLSRFDSIAKIIRISLVRQDGLQGDIPDESLRQMKLNKKAYKPRIPTKVPFYKDRGMILDLLQYHYHGTQEDRQRIEKLVGKEWWDISKRFGLLRNKFNIQPHEVGITRFRGAGEKGRKDAIIVPNYVIKSHTGVFDEEEDIN